MLRLRLLLLPLVELEKKTRSMSLTMDELHTLRDKPDLEEDIVKLEAASRCVWGRGERGRVHLYNRLDPTAFRVWFEDEEDCQTLCPLHPSPAVTRM